MSTRHDLRILGMDCAEEVSLLRTQLSKLPGVEDLQFQVFQGKMTVVADPAAINADDIKREVASLGMRARDWSETRSAQPAFWEHHGRQILVALSAAGLTGGIWVQAAVEQADLFHLLLLHEAHTTARTPPLALALFVLAIIAGMYPYFRKALTSIVHIRPDMNALVLIALLGAVALGEWIEGGMLATLYGLSGMLENWSASKARNAIKSLVAMVPAQATVIHGHGEHVMPVDLVPVGETVRIKAGERVACDGKVLRGSSHVNEALITGESMPVEKTAGDRVFAGAINGEGMLEIQVTRPASDSTLARIIRMVEDSQRRRAPTERFVDRLARVYTPIMFLVAAAASIAPPLLFGSGWSDSFYRGMLILLISCPCALVISTPVTIVSALASAARRGVLVKGGAYLEEAAKLEVIAFDKTGVLTLGEPDVRRLAVADGHEEPEVLRRLAALEGRSEHPLARAVARYAMARGIAPAAVSNFQALGGRGASAVIEGREFWIGNERLLQERRPSHRNGLPVADAPDGAAHTVVAFGSADDIWAVVDFADSIRPEAREAMDLLKGQGISRILMLTGDNEATARAVAAEAGIGEYQANLLPEDKAKVIEMLKSQHRHVAMVGDGINDAQAITLAHLGVALGQNATDVALETAQVVLMSEDLRGLPFLIAHARRAVRVVKENVAVALGLKLIFLALALAGFASLWMAIVADMGATLLVTVNGLRLLRPTKLKTPG